MWPTQLPPRHTRQWRISFCNLDWLMQFQRQRDNAKLKSNRRRNNMSRMNLSGYAGHATAFCWMFTIACYFVVGLGLRLALGLDFSVRLVSCYAHVLVRLLVVIVTVRREGTGSNSAGRPPPQCRNVCLRHWSNCRLCISNVISFQTPQQKRDTRVFLSTRCRQTQPEHCQTMTASVA